MIEPDTAFYNDIDAAFAESWRLLSQGVTDRKSAFHHATVASLGLKGDPRLRTVILRGCEPKNWSLRFHTDMRSNKVAELRNDPRVSMQFYDPDLGIQLRLECKAYVHSDDKISDSAWAETRIFSRQCYGISPGPGASIAEGGDYYWPENSDEATKGGRVNFCAVVMTAARFEWLYLASGGHRRASFEKTSEGYSARWLAP